MVADLDAAAGYNRDLAVCIKIIIFNTKFIIFDTDFIILNTDFIISNAKPINSNAKSTIYNTKFINLNGNRYLAVHVGNLVALLPV